MIKDGKQVKIVRIYLEDFEARKYETMVVLASAYNKFIKDNFQTWLNTINMAKGTNYKGYVLTGQNHLCKFCGGFVAGINRDEMCDFCSERFCTRSYKQFKKERARSRLNEDDTFL
jgi:rubrerythrin